jgi:carboxyl-terminal processing protease
MRQLVFALLVSILFYGQSAQAQGASSQPAVCIEQASKVLNEAFSLMKKFYYKKDSVQWEDLFAAARTRLSNSVDCESAQEALQWCFKEMKEKHSFVLPKAKAAVYNGNVNSSAEPTPLHKLIGPLRHELAEKDIAYIDVPWISTADKKLCVAFADSLQKLIAEYDQQGITKWIIDLRNNTGGNCWPMLAGLGPLLGNGVYGYFVSANEKIPFSYKNGTVMQGAYARCATSTPYSLAHERNAIVVLTGPNTASAGEIVALAFKGMNDVFLYGEPTAGLTTANATYNLSDGSVLVLTVCKEADRTGRIQEGKIQPDRLIAPAANRGKDEAKSAALMFLQTL